MSENKIEPHWTMILTKGKEPIVKRSDTLNDHLNMILECRKHFPDAEIVSLRLNPGDHNQLWAESHKTFLAGIDWKPSIINTYKIAAYTALRESDPKKAAAAWKQVSLLLGHLKDNFPYDGTPELYVLILDYKSEADKRYYQNLQDSECSPLPESLLPKKDQ